MISYFDWINFTFLASLHPNSENLRIPWFHRTLDLALWIHCFPNLLSCVIDWLRWEDLSTQYVDALCCSAYALEPGWAQIISPRWIPNPDNLRRRGLYQILFDYFVQWLEITCLLLFRSGECAGIWGCWGLFPPRILRNQRTPRVTSHSARILRNHRTRRAYSEIIVLDRWERIPQKSEKIGKKEKKEKRTCRGFFFFFSFSAKKPWNLIIWNMGEIVVFPAFWAVAHTIAFHEIQVV